MCFNVLWILSCIPFYGNPRWCFSSHLGIEYSMGTLLGTSSVHIAKKVLLYQSEKVQIQEEAEWLCRTPNDTHHIQGGVTMNPKKSELQFELACAKNNKSLTVFSWAWQANIICIHVIMAELLSQCHDCRRKALFSWLE